nr:reverse transcriptase domain-containing protein [Tanacetum cinerariifolium]
ADDDGDDLSEDDADDEEEEEEEEHLALTFPALALLLAIPSPPLSPVSPTSYPLPPFLMPLSIFTPLPTSSFPLPSSLPSTSGSESIPEADIPLRKRARFTTPTCGYEVGKSSVAAARQIRPALTIADRRRADDRLISRLRRKRRYFRTLSTTYAQEVAHSRDYCIQIMDYCQSREVHTSTLATQIEALQRDVRVAAAMAEAEASRVRNGYGNNGSGPRLAQAVRECTYPDFLKSACRVKYAVCTLQGVALTCWNSHVKTVTLEVAQALPWKTLKKMMTDKYCPGGEIKKLEIETKNQGHRCDRVEKYTGGVPDTIHDSVKATKPKTMQEAIEFSTELTNKRIRDAVENKQKFEGTSGNNQNQPQQNKRQNTGRAYAAGNSDRNMEEMTMLKEGVCGWKCGGKPRKRRCGSQINIAPIALDHHYNVEIVDGMIIGLNTIMRDCTLNFLNHPFNIDLLPVELGSIDVIVGMDWLSKYDAVIACAEKLVRIPFGNKILTIRGEGNNKRNESRLNIISCSKAQEYMSKGCHVFLANITSTKDEDKSKGSN